MNHLPRTRLWITRHRNGVAVGQKVFTKTKGLRGSWHELLDWEGFRSGHRGSMQIMVQLIHYGKLSRGTLWGRARLSAFVNREIFIAIRCHWVIAIGRRLIGGLRGQKCLHFKIKCRIRAPSELWRRARVLAYFHCKVASARNIVGDMEVYSFRNSN